VGLDSWKRVRGQTCSVSHAHLKLNKKKTKKISAPTDDTSMQEKFYVQSVVVHKGTGKLWNTCDPNLVFISIGPASELQLGERIEGIQNC